MFWKKPSILVVAVLLVLATIVLVPMGGSDTVESSFGSWKVEIKAVMADGSTQPLSVVTNYAAQLLAMNYDGKEIIGINYKLKAKAEGAGYTQCELDLSNVYTDPYFYNDDCSYEHFFDKNYGDASVLIDLDTGFVTVMETTVELSGISPANGDYKLELRSVGTAKYRGIGSENGPWESDKISGISSILDIVVSDADGGGDDGDDDDDGDDTYVITVAAAPYPDYIWCSGGEYGPEPVVHASIATFERPPGTYSVKVHWLPPMVSEEKTAEKYITVVDQDVGVIFNYFTLCMLKSLTFTVDYELTSHSPYYVDSGHYLGSN